MPERIDFVTLGPFPADLARDLAARTSRRLPLPCRLVRIPTPPLPLVAGRAQVDADRVLASLEALPAPEGTILVGLTVEDVGSPLFTHFFGRARLNGRAALVSVARLSPVFHGLPDDPAVTSRRAEIEILHEVGHVLGLAHCRDFACLMHVTTDVDELDSRGTAWCAECARRLPASVRPSARAGDGRA